MLSHSIPQESTLSKQFRTTIKGGYKYGADNESDKASSITFTKVTLKLSEKVSLCDCLLKLWNKPLELPYGPCSFFAILFLYYY